MANRFVAWLSRTVTNILKRDLPLSALAEYLIASDNVTGAWRYAQYAREGFELNPIVNACIREITESGSAIRIRMLIDGEIPDPKKKLIPAHQALADLLKKPNGSTEISQQAFVERFLLHLLVGGVAYIHAVGIGNKPLTEDISYLRTTGELELIQPDRVEPQVEKGRITGFKIIDLEGQPILPVDDVLMIRFPHPRFKYQGFSPIQAAAVVIDTHNNGIIWNNSLLKNMGLISGIAVIKGVRTTNEEKRRKLEKEFEDKYVGPRNVGKVKVIAGEGVEYISLGHSVKDLDWLSGKQDLMRDICAVMRVPSQLINDPGASTYANYREAKRAFYFKTILPIMNRYVAGLISWLVPKFDDSGRVTLDLDLSDIEVLRENENERVERLERRKAWWTINELRKDDGLEEIPGGDTIYMPFNLTPIEDLAEAGAFASDESLSVDAIRADQGYGPVPGPRSRRPIVTRWSDGDNEFRYQIRDPEQFDRFQLVVLRAKRPRVFMVYGRVTGTDRWKKQGLWFAKTAWSSIDKCRHWLRDHPESRQDRLSDTIETRSGETDVTLPHVDPRSIYPTAELRFYKLERKEHVRIRNERKFRPVIRKFMDRQRDQIIAEIKQLTTLFPRSGRTDETRDQLLDEELVAKWFIQWTEQSKWIEAFDSLYTGVILDVGDEVMAELVAAGFVSDQIDFDITHPDIERWLTAGLAERSRLINQATARRIQRLLERAVKDGVGSDEIERRIVDEFASINRHRAKAIARTEVGISANIANANAYEQSGVPIKEWISARAPTPLGYPVREDHAELDGQVRNMDEDFKIENGPYAGATAPTPMQFGIPSQDINCRCDMAPLRNVDEAF